MCSKDRDWLLQAIELSRQCATSTSAFSVGAVLHDRDGREVATGFSRELGEGLHAEEIAIAKAGQSDLLGGTLYCSMEPCSVRLSGKLSCAERIRGAGIARVVFALREPPIFVVCEGTQLLRRYGVEVLVLDEYSDLVREINGHLLASASARNESGG